MSTEIDLFKYGQLVAQVDQLSTKVDKLEAGMEELLALANKGRGGFWVGKIICSNFPNRRYVAHNCPCYCRS